MEQHIIRRLHIGQVVLARARGRDLQPATVIGLKLVGSRSIAEAEVELHADGYVAYYSEGDGDLKDWLADKW